MYIAIKTKKTNTKKHFLRKTRIGKLIICNGKLIIIYLLLPHKLIQMHIAIKTNEKNTENKSVKKAKYLCNGKVLIMNLSISKCFIYFTHILLTQSRLC